MMGSGGEKQQENERQQQRSVIIIILYFGPKVEITLKYDYQIKSSNLYKY